MTEATAAGPSVLIVGAGPTGLALAIGLVSRGVPTRVIEAAAGPQPGSRGKGVQPRTLEVFEDLGIADRVIEQGRMAMPIRSTAADGTVTVGRTEPDASRDRPDIPYSTSLVTPQWRVEEALRQRLAALGGRVDFGTTLTDLSQSDRAVTALLSEGGRPETVRTRWLVGCDGGHSAVRKLAGIAFVGATRESVRMIVADLEVGGLDRDAWHLWRHSEGLVSLCPLPSTSVFQYQAGIAPGQDAELSLANLRSTFLRRSGRTDIRLRDMQWSSLWRANVRLADSYREGQVLLAGDAAHIHSPAGGQGMNTGIQDAYNLGWKLASVEHGAPADLIDSYEAERRPVAAAVLALSDARLKHTLDQRSMPIRRSADTTQMGVSYRGSTLVCDDRGGTATLRAGDRAPDAPHLATVSGPRRLFELLHHGGFTVLDFAGVPARRFPDGVRVLAVVARPIDRDDVTDGSGRLAETYGATERTLVLIRPDGYIAAISDSGDAAVIAARLAILSPTGSLGER